MHIKGIAVVAILILVSVSVIPSASRLMSGDDTTPPVTTHSLNPPEPDGDNDWYVDDVEVTLNATDDISGVKEIKYKVGTGDWKTIQGSEVIFTLTVADDADDLPIEYYAIDNVGNEESINSFTIDMDQTRPKIQQIQCKSYEKNKKLFVEFYCYGVDKTSGMNRVVMYINEGVYEINNTPDGSVYKFVIQWCSTLKRVSFRFEHYDNAGNMDWDEVWGNCIPFTEKTIIGLICNPVISDNNISFFAILVIKTTWDPLPSRDSIILKRVVFPNRYTGYVGRFIIFASYY